MVAEWIGTPARLMPMATSLASWTAAVLFVLVVTGCATSRTPAPVDSRDPRAVARQPAPQARVTPQPPAPLPPPPPMQGATGAPAADLGPDFYTVKRGDTLFNIALDHGVSYRELADWNNIANPNQIRVDQVLRVRPAVAATAAAAPPPGSGSVEVRPLAQVQPLQSRPLESRPLESRAPPDARPQDTRPPTPRPADVRQAQAAADPIKSEPRALKLRYSEENLALVKPRPQLVAPPAPATPSAAPSAPAVPVPVVAAPAPPPVPPKAAAVAPSPSGGDDDDDIEWGWPTVGKVMAGFSESANKGLDIAGKGGQPVMASASGTVLYVGSGIRGYGKLIVIRHSKAWSTVYAHNSEIMVKEGQRVVKGQKVAEMGNTDADQVKLHFEIRKLGKPVDPSKLLPAS